MRSDISLTRAHRRSEGADLPLMASSLRDATKITAADRLVYAARPIELTPYTGNAMLAGTAKGEKHAAKARAQFTQLHIFDATATDATAAA